jgi:hypothetical protein
MTTETGTDMGIGLGVLFSLVAGTGAMGMYLTAPEPTAGYAFAGAMIFGALAVAALHLYD